MLRYLPYLLIIGLAWSRASWCGALTQKTGKMEFGKYLPSNKYHRKTYKITKLGPVVNEGYIKFSYVEQDFSTGSIIGEEYSNEI